MYYKANRLLSFATAVALFVTTSCNKSETNLPTDSTEKVKVSILLDGISQSFEPMSKVAVTLPDTLRLRVTLNVFNNDGNVVYSDEKLLTESGGSIPVEFMIEKGLYDIAFWADYVVFKDNAVSEQAYSFSTLQEITPDADFNGDAFSLILREIDVNDDMTLTEGTSLTRAVSMLRIESTDNVPEAAKQVRYTLSKTTTSLNLLTGLPTISESPVSYENALTAGSPIDISRYLLPCDKFTCTIEALGESGEPIVAYEMENVATEPNVKTVLKGNFFSDGVSTSLTLGMETAWNADRNYVITPNAQPSGPNINDQEIVFPDGGFRDYCLANFDADGNGIIQYKEIKNVREIDLGGIFDVSSWIESLEGIEYFTALEQLTIGMLNSTKNVSNIKSLDLSKNIYLTELSIYSYQLTSIELGTSKNLKSLSISSPKLTSIDLSDKVNLLSLTIDNTPLDKLDLSHNKILNSLTLEELPITYIDLSYKTNLQTVTITNCLISEITTTGATALSVMSCSKNNITNLDLSTNKALKNLYCDYNQLETLDLSQNNALSSLNCENNVLTTLDLSNNKSLSWVECEYNPLTTIWLYEGYKNSGITLQLPETATIMVK